MSTFVDETSADLPVKDIPLTLSPFAIARQGALVGQNGRARQNIAHVSRDELEDRFLRLHEENLLLKQTSHHQEDKLKRLATKLVRLVKDRRRLEQLAEGGGGASRPAPRVRDVEMEEMMEELHEKVRELTVANEGLKQRLLVAKQQQQVQSRRPSPYGCVQSRVNTGLRRARDNSPSPSRLRQRSTRSADGIVRPPTGMLPRYGHSLLEDARAEIKNLENVIESQRGQLEEMVRVSALLKDQLRRVESEHEEALLQLRQHQTDGERSTIGSNMKMIRLQKQLAERANSLTLLEGRFLHLQESQRAMKASHEALVAKVEELMVQLRDERMKGLELENQLRNMSFSQVRSEELQERIIDLEKEKDLLKENCDKLVNSAYDVSQEQKWRVQEQQLRVQIAQLETALKADLTDKNQILDKIKAEREKSEKLAEENKHLQVQVLEQKQKLEELNDRIKFYTKETESDGTELSEALMLIKARKSRQNGDLSFLERVEEGSGADTQSAVRELRAAHAETIQELEKTRGLLLIQNKINKDYQAELEVVTRKIEGDKMEYELKLERLAKLLDSKAARVKKLEARLKDIAYGTKPYVFKPNSADEDVADELEESVRLEHGENLLQIHLGRATLSSSALEALGDRQPSTFCTYSFYAFELHGTPVATGPTPAFDFTSQYVVRMDDFFMEYLHTHSLTVELHQAVGLTFKTLAAGQLRLRELLEQDGKVSGTVQLIGVSGEVQCIGSLEFWIRLRVPMQQTIQLYRERLKALGYMNTALNEETQATPQSGVNVLGVTVQSCSDLPTRGSHHPSPYVFYKFYDFPHHDTPVVHDRRHPNFHHHTPYSVAMDADLDRYLKSEELQFYVFDFGEDRIDSYLGKARVPLLTLAHNKDISGVFELSSPSGSPAGQIEVTLNWKFPYQSPPGSAVTVARAASAPREKPARLTPEHLEIQPLEADRKHDAEETSEQLKEMEEEDRRDKQLPHCSTSFPAGVASKASAPKPRRKALDKDKQVAKKVSFLDGTGLSEQVDEQSLSSSTAASEKRESSKLPPLRKGVSEVTPAPPTTTEDEEEADQYSEGQLIPVSSQAYSDDSEMSQESIEEDIEGPSSSVVGGGQEESDLSDSDDCIVPGQALIGKKSCERVRVEIVAVSLKPESRAARDPSVVRLFVEYSLLDLPSQETPMSLPKPAPGQSVHYNYSNVIHVDPETNRSRRELLRGVLEGRNPQMESIRFTVVSEPPEEEEQERECEDVGVAYLRIPEILEKQQDLIETRLNVVEAADSSVVLGSLTVSVEALEALRSVMNDPEHKHTALQAAT